MSKFAPASRGRGWCCCGWLAERAQGCQWGWSGLCSTAGGVPQHCITLALGVPPCLCPPWHLQLVLPLPGPCQVPVLLGRAAAAPGQGRTRDWALQGEGRDGWDVPVGLAEPGQAGWEGTAASGTGLALLGSPPHVPGARNVGADYRGTPHTHTASGSRGQTVDTWDTPLQATPGLGPPLQVTPILHP